MKAVSSLFAAGLLVLFLGGAGDLTYHALEQGSPVFRNAHQLVVQQELDSVFGRDGNRAHLVTLAGMVLTVAGVVRRGLSRPRD